MSEAEAQKRAAGEAAAALVEDGMVVGLGTGSTAVWFVRALAARGLDLTCVATSTATADLAASLGLKLAELGETRPIDLTVDGADEIGPGLALIKGGGGALLREKLVWEASRRCVVIADAAKCVTMLGKFPLPIEVVAFGHQTTALRICDALSECDIGAAPRLRMKDGEPVRTDGGNLIYDAACGRIEEPAALAFALKSVTGVVDHGLFLDLADQALIGGASGVTTLEP
ncbi:MAG: rpiA [Phenylobacterium sp.]|uniref:ribose-5-phosphate isomerase RpiA n=1 Tax=Phenylobacterium sp. TaxID=1871053 RepID=UPI002604DB46|nr:ribose-5-phosphate isomerase RpiA [Phenylobacterium sp.]MDB5497975.1 rpiA [Phenylobacterium sp.]